MCIHVKKNLWSYPIKPQGSFYGLLITLFSVSCYYKDKSCVCSFECFNCPCKFDFSKLSFDPMSLELEIYGLNAPPP